MRASIVSILALAAACAPTSTLPPPASSTPAPDALAVQASVSIGQAAIANVTKLTVSGPNLEIVEYRTGAAPNAPSSLLPGRVSAVTVSITADWASAERALENWPLSYANASGAAPQKQSVVISFAGGGGAAPSTYTLNACLPEEMRLELPAQGARATQMLIAQCESLTRS